MQALIVATFATAVLGTAAYRHHAAQQKEQLYFMQSNYACVASAWYGARGNLDTPSEQRRRFLRFLNEDFGTLLTSIADEDGLSFDQTLPVPQFTAA